MDPEEVQGLYGPNYASVYDQVWADSPTWASEARTHVEWLGHYIDPAVRWLDVGCGTGWFLSQFPGTRRAGLDLSPAMLERARAANPDAITFRQGDIRVDIPEWFGAWDFVSSTGQAWCYGGSMDAIATAAENMARWAAPTGRVFVQTPDLTDVTGFRLDYDFVGGPPAHDSISVTGVVWNYTDQAGTHENMIWPSVDVWVRWYCQWFSTVEVFTWPHEPAFLPCPRRLVVASGKRASGDLSPATVIVHPDPAVPDRTEPQVLVSKVPARPLTPRRVEAVRLTDRTVGDVLARAKPWKRSFWRSVSSRTRRLAPGGRRAV